MALSYLFILMIEKMKHFSYYILSYVRLLSKSLEEQKYLSDLELRNEFVEETPKAWSLKKIIDKKDFIKNTIFALQVTLSRK